LVSEELAFDLIGQTHVGRADPADIKVKGFRGLSGDLPREGKQMLIGEDRFKGIRETGGIIPVAFAARIIG